MLRLLMNRQKIKSFYRRNPLLCQHSYWDEEYGHKHDKRAVKRPTTSTTRFEFRRSCYIESGEESGSKLSSFVPILFRCQERLLYFAVILPSYLFGLHFRDFISKLFRQDQTSLHLESTLFNTTLKWSPNVSRAEYQVN